MNIESRHNNIGAHEHHILAALLRFLKITYVQLIAFSVVGVVVLLTSRLQWLMNKVGVDQDITESFKQYFEDLNYKYDLTSALDNVSSVLVWAVIGATVYLVIWAIIVLSIDAYNDLVISTRFVHPESFHQSDYWMAIMLRFFLRAAGFVLIGALTIWLFADGLPLLFGIAYNVWSDSSVYRAVLIIIATIALLYAYVISLRLAFGRTRLY